MNRIVLPFSRLTGLDIYPQLPTGTQHELLILALSSTFTLQIRGK
jgi:hypothetical protein